MKVELELQYPDGRKLRRPLDREVLNAGRSAESDIVVAHPTVGDPHAQLRLTGRRISIKDLGPTTPTLLNGERLQHFVEHRVDPGDILHLGDVRILVRVEGVVAHRYPAVVTQAIELDDKLRPVARALVCDMESGLRAIQPAADLEIAERLGVSVATVERRIGDLKDALGVDRSDHRSRVALARKILETRCHER